MIIIRNNIIPFNGFKAINLFEFVFVRKKANFTSADKRHEYIHSLQMREMLYVGFYIWYMIEYICRWLWRLFHKPSAPYYRKRWLKMAYYDISLEQEAYTHQEDTDYIDNRKYYSWWKYLKTRKEMPL